MSNYIINIFGAMATGKSTLADNLRNHIDRAYLVDFDVVKKQISGYDSKRDREVATKLTYGLLSAVAETELPIIALLPPPKNSEEYQQLLAITSRSQRKLINIELTASLETLEARYPYWLESHQALQEAGTKVKLRTLDEFLEAVQSPYFKPEDTRTFDSSKQSMGEILEQAKKLIS